MAAILRRVLKADQIELQARLGGLVRAVAEALGPLAGRARVLGLRRGVLTLAVASPAVLYEIKSFRETDILTRLRAECPERHVRRLKLVVMETTTKESSGDERRD